MKALRLNFVLLFIVGSIVSCPLAIASTRVIPFNEKDFIAAQHAGRSILVTVHADWCGVCVRQTHVLESLRAEPRFSDVLTFNVDFDTQKDVLRRLHAPLQSTLICFVGQREVGRSVGETQPEWIEDLLTKSFRSKPPHAGAAG